MRVLDSGLITPITGGRERAVETMTCWIAENLAATKFVIFNAAGVCSGASDFSLLVEELASALGELIVQNADGAKIIEVYDRNAGRIEEGARYHQTRQGGDIHIDSVNSPAAIKHLLLGCVASATVGGETILVRASDVFERLAAAPEVLGELEAPFWFEGRGMDAAQTPLFKMPVVSIEGGSPRFRYLRSYIESAHMKAGEPLTSEQILAFDYLDSVLEDSRLQQRHLLECGQILVTLDTEVFHGRTSFVDLRKGDVVGWSAQRKMLRVWVA